MDKLDVETLAGDAADLARALIMAIEGSGISDETRSPLVTLASQVAGKCAKISEWVNENMPAE